MGLRRVFQAFLAFVGTVGILEWEGPSVGWIRLTAASALALWLGVRASESAGTPLARAVRGFGAVLLLWGTASVWYVGKIRWQYGLLHPSEWAWLFRAFSEGAKSAILPGIWAAILGMWWGECRTEKR